MLRTGSNASQQRLVNIAIILCESGGIAEVSPARVSQIAPEGTRVC